ncbi:hypothetical protein RRG08_015338 [Elysia crispata]|uniref:Galectin n=1 Tax=Elysia crispata TaxID=231223 RepID=A0AAE1DVE8_9GAST|nr:hypothetical protein RRG08_015338 [Elysia crispata]
MARVILHIFVLRLFGAELLKTWGTLSPGAFAAPAPSPRISSGFYSMWPGRLEGCVCHVAPSWISLNIRVLECARTAQRQNSTAFKLDQDTGECNVCSVETLTGYKYNASLETNHFWLFRRLYWTGLDTDVEHMTLIDGGLKTGMIFELFGTLQYRINRFTLFWSSQHIVFGSSDFALKIQFFPQLGKSSQLVVLKAVVGGVSTTTETVLTPPAIVLGTPFRMLMVVARSGYQIYIDGLFCCEFFHVHTNLSSVQWLFKSPSGYHVIHSIVF